MARCLLAGLLVPEVPVELEPLVEDLFLELEPPLFFELFDLSEELDELEVPLLLLLPFEELLELFFDVPASQSISRLYSNSKH